MPSTERIVLLGAVAAVGIIVIYAVFSLTSVPGTVTSKVPGSFSANGRTYTFTYIATTEQERETGLMNKVVNDTTTMLFAFPSSGHWVFWMFDTPTSLDMIWVNATGNSGKVVYLVSSAPPCLTSNSSTCTKYTPTSAANYVIEAKAGFASANMIKAGSSIQFGS